MKKETISPISTLLHVLDEAYGRPVHEDAQVVPRFAEDEAGGNGDRDPAAVPPARLP